MVQEQCALGFDPKLDHHKRFPLDWQWVMCVTRGAWLVQFQRACVLGVGGGAPASYFYVLFGLVCLYY